MRIFSIYLHHDVGIKKKDYLLSPLFSQLNINIFTKYQIRSDMVYGKCFKIPFQYQRQHRLS